MATTHLNGNHRHKVIARRRVYTTGQIAAIAGVSPRIAAGWIDKGKLKGYRIPDSQDRRVTHEEVIRFLREHEMPIPVSLAYGGAILLVGGVRALADQLHAAANSGGWQVMEGGLVRAGEIIASVPLAGAVLDTAGLGRRASLDAAIDLKAAFERSYSGQFPVVFVLAEDETAEGEFSAVGTTFCRPFHPQQLVRHLEALIEAAR